MVSYKMGNRNLPDIYPHTYTISVAYFLIKEHSDNQKFTITSDLECLVKDRYNIYIPFIIHDVCKMKRYSDGITPRWIKLSL